MIDKVIVKSHLCLLIAIATISTSLWAQEKENVNPKRDNEGSRIIKGPSEKGKKNFYLIKINPLLVLNGDVPLYLERSITNKITLEVGVGVTMKDFIFNFFYANPQANSSNYDLIETRRYPIGYSLSFGGRFYVSREEFGKIQGSYIAGEVRYRSYKSEALKCEATGLPGASTSLINSDYIAESRQLTDFKAMFGNVSYLTNRLFLEYYTGIGIRIRKISHAYCNEIGSSPSTVLLFQNSIRPVFSLGLKFGLSF